MSKRIIEAAKISKNKKTKKEKSDVSELPFGFIENLAEYDLLDRRHKLTSEGKSKLRRLLDTYDSVQACRRRKALELLPETDELISAFLVKKYSASKDVSLPLDPYPYAWSDDEPLPCIPPEEEEPSLIDKGAVGKESQTPVNFVEKEKTDAGAAQNETAEEKQLLHDFYKTITE